MTGNFEKFRPVEVVTSAAYAIRLLGSEALAAIDRRLDWVPDDTGEDARIRSEIWTRMNTVAEAPVETEEELNDEYDAQQGRLF